MMIFASNRFKKECDPQAPSKQGCAVIQLSGNISNTFHFVALMRFNTMHTAIVATLK
jgi:hypothetical protein